MLRILLAVLLAVSVPAWAQNYPAKPVRMIVAFPAGGGSDIVGRIVAAKLSERLGQQVVVENRAGGGGSIGAEAAVKAAPDGYTIALAGTSEIAVNPFIYKLAYDPVKELVPVGFVGATPMVIVVTPSLSAKSASDLVALAKSQPGQLNVGSAGNGSLTHLAGEAFRTMNGRDVDARAVQGSTAGAERSCRRARAGDVLYGAGRNRPHQVRPDPADRCLRAVAYARAARRSDRR
jgi:tripartite-type tricarboxylate transporter receptor subunit TctC